MTMWKKWLMAVAGVAVFAGVATTQEIDPVIEIPEGTETENKAPEEKELLDPENTLFMDLIYGRVAIKLFPDVAPEHVARIKQLTREGFYDRLYFHRVIDGFMAQTGDPQNDGSGGSDYPNLPAEFSDTLTHKEGTLSMARSDDPNSANSQFFIVFEDGGATHLDGQYTIFGEVVTGMRFVGRIQKGEGVDGEFNDPLDRDRILRMRVAADVNAENKAKKAEGSDDTSDSDDADEDTSKVIDENLEENMAVPVTENDLPTNDQ